MKFCGAEIDFENIVLPKKPIKLDRCTTITEPQKFIESHIATLKANENNVTFKPFVDRLQRLKEILKQSNAI